MNAVNVPIPLGDVKIAITVRGQPVQTVARVHLRLLPKPSVVFECEVKDKPFGACDFDLGEEVVLENLGIRLNIQPLRIVMPNPLGNIVKLAFTPNPEPCTVVRQDGQRLQSVTFDVLNFPSFIGPQDIFEDYTDDHGGSGLRRRGRVNLEADGWRINVMAVPDLKEIEKALKEQGGYGVTHKGTLKRSNGGTFSIEDAEEAMICLWRFFSFARGLHCGPILPIGINDKGVEVWKQWGCPTVEFWGWPFSWFDRDCSETLAEVFPGFWGCLNGGPYAAAARIALAWYLRSNQNNGGGLILSQAALERLADTHGFKGSAAKCIRALVNKHSIPQELPDGLDTLKKVLEVVQKNEVKNGGRDKIFDGPEALVAVRNDLVHPKDKLLGISGIKEYEAWSLAQWYVELVLLNMFGFNGKYGNRLIAGRWSGQTDLVPWAAAADRIRPC